MSRLLYRWGRFAALHTRGVLALWLVLVAAVGALLATQPTSISTSLTLENTPSQSVLDQIAAEMPAAGGTQGTVAISAADGGRVDTPERAAAISQALSDAVATGYVVDRSHAVAAQREELETQVRAQVQDQLASSPAGTSPEASEEAVAQALATAQQNMATLQNGTSPTGTPLTVGTEQVPGVLVSEDGRTAVMSLQLTGQISDMPSGTLDAIMAAVDGALAPADLTSAASSSLQPIEPPLGGHEAVGLAVAVVVLMATLGSLVLAGLPILTALLGAFLGVGGAYALSSHFEMTTATPAIGLMLGLAVGIDYALFIIHKQRSLTEHLQLDRTESIARAVATAGGAVLFAGSTVIIALLGLLTLGIGFVTTMALVASVTVALAVLLALTAVPALLGVAAPRGPVEKAGAGEDRRPPHAQVPAATAPPRSRFGRAAQRWVRFVTRRPLATIAVVVIALGVVALPARHMELGMPSGAVAHAGSPARVNDDAVTSALGAGANAPLVVALTPDEPTGVDQGTLLEWQKSLAAENHVDNVRLMGATDDHDLVIFTVTPDAGPTALTTADLVTSLRTQALPGVSSVGVTGATAINIDLSDALADAVPVYLVVVVGLSLVVLLLVLRSLVVPLAATVGFLLTIASTLGLTVAAFSTDGLTHLVGVDRAGPVLSFLPVMVTGILYGLAMDYQVFLGTSMREEHVHGADARTAVARGFHHASRVVLAAAVIMVAVFAGFALSTDTTIRQFGFALSVGVLIDALLVRMTLMPAVMALTGERAWWLPRWLDRLLPVVDIEGAGLTTTSGATTGPES